MKLTLDKDGDLKGLHLAWKLRDDLACIQCKARDKFIKPTLGHDVAQIIWNTLWESLLDSLWRQVRDAASRRLKMLCGI